MPPEILFFPYNNKQEGDRRNDEEGMRGERHLHTSGQMATSKKGGQNPYGVRLEKVPRKRETCTSRTQR